VTKRSVDRLRLAHSAIQSQSQPAAKTVVMRKSSTEGIPRLGREEMDILVTMTPGRRQLGRRQMKPPGYASLLVAGQAAIPLRTHAVALTPSLRQERIANVRL
jgi:hypothetical protein